jgi:hypothetical protein
MVNFKKRLTYGLLKHFLGFAIFVIVFGVIAAHHQKEINHLSISAYYQALITFITGSMIAIFLAVFYSDSIKIKYARHHRGALTLYILILLELIILVVSGLFVRDGSTAPLVLVIMTTVMLDVTYIIARLISLALADD